MAVETGRYEHKMVDRMKYFTQHDRNWKGTMYFYGVSQRAEINIPNHFIDSFNSISYQSGRVGRVVAITMGPNWEDIKRVQLLDRDQRRDQRKWDVEFQRRREDLIRQKKESGERKIRNSMKLAEMSARWRSLEQKRTNQNELYLERLRTSLSLTLRQDGTRSAGADSFTSER